METPVWSYGVTTVPERHNLFRQTLLSLGAGGFDRPHVFMDGGVPTSAQVYGLPYTARVPRTFTATDRGGRPCGSSAGPWALALYELYLRNPWADRYALFQDDCVCCRNLKPYLDALRFEPKTYWNLFTFTSNHLLAKGRTGFYPSNQQGRGAVGLVFDRQGVVDLLASKEWAERPQDKERGHKSLDGGVVNVLGKQGYAEWVHNPSLLQHVGAVSSMGNLPHNPSPCFAGETYDALQLLPAR